MALFKKPWEKVPGINLPGQIGFDTSGNPVFVTPAKTTSELAEQISNPPSKYVSPSWEQEQQSRYAGSSAKEIEKQINAERQEQARLESERKAQQEKSIQEAKQRQALIESRKLAIQQAREQGKPLTDVQRVWERSQQAKEIRQEAKRRGIDISTEARERGFLSQLEREKITEIPQEKKEVISSFKEPTTYKGLVKEYGFFTGTIRKFGFETEQFLLKQEQPVTISDIPPYKLKGSISPNKNILSLISPEEQKEIIERKTKLTAKAGKEVMEFTPYFIPYVGAGALVGVGTERLVTTGGKRELNEIGEYLESKGLPSRLKYAVPVTEIGLGVLGLRAELKTLSNVRKLAREYPIGEATTKTISVDRQTATNFVLSNADDSLRTLIQKNRLSGSRIYETTIPVKAGEKKIYWVELSSAKGTGKITQGRRILYGVELDAKGNVISNLGGLSIERINEKGTSNLLTQIVRETKGERKLYITPTEERTLYTYAEEIRLKGTGKLGRVQATISESQTQLISKEDVLGLFKKGLDKGDVSYTGLNIPQPIGGTKAISKEITLLGQPSLKVTKQKFKGMNWLSVKAEQRSLSIGLQDNLLKPSFKIIKETKPFTEEIVSSTGQISKQITQQQLGRTSGFAKAFAETISTVKPVSQPSKILSSIYAGTGMYERYQPSENIFVTTKQIEPVSIFDKTLPVSIKEEINLGEGNIPSLTGMGIKGFGDTGRFKDLGTTETRFDLGLKDKEKTKEQQIEKNNLKFFQEAGQEQKPVQKEKEREKQIELQLVKSINIQKVKDLLKPRQEIKNTFKFKSQPPKPRIGVPPPIVPPTKTSPSTLLKRFKEEPDMFEVLGKRFGKEFTIITTPSKKKAEEETFKFLKGTLGRSARILKSGEPIEFKELKLLKGYEFTPAKRESTRIVQKAKFSLGTGAEVKEIQMFKKKGKRRSIL